MTMPTDLPPLPEAVTTIGPCMFGGEPSVETPLYTADQLRAFGHACRVVALSEDEREALEELERVADGRDYCRTINGKPIAATLCAALRRLAALEPTP